MYLNFQSVIVDLVVIAIFIYHAFLAFAGIKNMLLPLNTLLNKGVTDHIFNKVKKWFYASLVLLLGVTCLITWRFYEVVSFFDVTSYGAYILVAIFGIYGFTILSIYIFCKLLLVTAQRAGL